MYVCVYIAEEERKGGRELRTMFPVAHPPLWARYQWHWCDADIHAFQVPQQHTQINIQRVGHSVTNYQVSVL